MRFLYFHSIRKNITVCSYTFCAPCVGIYYVYACAVKVNFPFFVQEKVEVRVARIFNTYGPRMLLNDGRVVSNFILQALQNHSITVSRKKLHQKMCHKKRKINI